MTAPLTLPDQPAHADPARTAIVAGRHAPGPAYVDLLTRLADRSLSRQDRIALVEQAAEQSHVVDVGPAGAPCWTVFCGIRQQNVTTLRCEGTCALDSCASDARAQIRTACPVWQRWTKQAQGR